MPINDTILATDSIRVVFTRRRDRVSHSIELLDKKTQSWQSVLESVEGEPDDAWPTSPPLQQLHIEQRGNLAVALMVGMAGVGHWSASIETLPDDAIHFDLACRSTITPARLQSAYRIVRPQLGSTLKFEPHAQTVLQSRESELIFAPQHLADSVPATFRWGYNISSQSSK